MRRTPLLFSLASILVASPALAQDGTTSSPADAASPPAPGPAPAVPKEKDENKPNDRSAYISISPLHLILPIVEITAEFRVHEKIGVAAIAGLGSVDPYQFGEKPPPGVKVGRFMVWELGGQFVGYLVGHFDHGMQLGAELLYAGVSGDATDGKVRATGTAQGLAMGPFIGYKYTTPVGFALNVQGGVQYVAMRAKAEGSNNATSSAEESAFVPLLNLNLGWAF